MKRILFTGGAGFIGSHIVDAYIKAGHDVTVIDNLSSGKKEFVHNKAYFIEADITDEKGIDKIIKQGNFDLVNHHAAQKSVTESVKDPIYDSKINIKGSLVLLEACRKYNIKEFIFASTGGALYGDAKEIPTLEDSEIAPESPYGIAKFAVENYLRFYRRLGIRTKILRYSNVYGPRQDPFGEAGVVAIFCQRILRSQSISVFGDGEQTRDFIFVEDIVRANLAIAKYIESGVWNIGTGVETPVNDIAKKIVDISGKKIMISYQAERIGELKRSCVSPQKAKTDFDWTSKTDLVSGLGKTYQSF